jgi:hypothetical protein
MKKLLIILTGLVLSLSACEEDSIEIEDVVLKEGTYTGYFTRSSPDARYAPSSVSLTLENNRFSGSSSIEKYPAICQGTYKITGQEIEFFNECPWTANFDWTYILSGKFTITVDGDEISMTRSYEDKIRDEYKLTRE